MESKSFIDLIVWQKAHAFTLSVYKSTADFPKDEIYGLTLQFRRAAISIPTNIAEGNIAEGFSKIGKTDGMRFFNFEMAQGSIEECRYYCILSRDLGYGNTEELIKQIDEVGKMLHTYISKIKDSMKK